MGGHRGLPLQPEGNCTCPLPPTRARGAGRSVFRPRGDVDNDGKWNVDECDNAVRTSGGVADMNAVALFVAAAMNRESDG